MNSKLFNIVVMNLIMVISLVFLSNCASTTPNNDESHPGWVEKGGGFFSGDRGSAIYGVGSADITANIGISMLRTASETRARADVARTIETKVEDLVKVYQGYMRDTQTDQIEEWIRAATSQFTEMNLPGTPIVDRHRCEKDGAYYALARMDLEQFKNTVERMERLSERAKEAIKLNAQEMFDEMARRAED